VTQVFEIPLVPGTPQRLSVELGETTYVLMARWNDISACWILDIYEFDGVTPVLRGVPMVTGADLLGQYEYLELGGNLIALTIAVGHPPDEVPTFDNLGIDGHLYYVVS
jgi:hypothetical protein